MAITPITRRAFLSVAAATGLTLTVGCPPPPDDTSNGVRVFKRSGRGLHVSNAAKKHNANRFYRTQQAASGDAPHPGDNSKVVSLTISREFHAQLFPGNRQIADLRSLG